MPPELPGFYFDESRNRYFPLSSKPKPLAFGSTPSLVPTKRRAPSSAASSKGSLRSSHRVASDPSEHDGGRTPSKRTSSWHVLHESWLSCSGSHLRRKQHVLDLSRTAATSACRLLRSDNKSAFSALDIIEVDGRVRIFSGDKAGFVWTVEVPVQDFTTNNIPHLQDSATGERGKFCAFIKDMRTEVAIVASYTPAIVRNVNATDLFEWRLALGGEGRVCIIKDINQPLIARSYRTKSDVLSLCQEHNMVYAGLRNDSLLRFDLRQPHSQEDNMIHRGHSSLVHLSRIREWELIVGAIDGSIGVYDLRFHKPTPLLTLHGHKNIWRHDLVCHTSFLSSSRYDEIPQPIAITPSQDILFAAGMDNRIRAWSLRTGAPLSPSTPPPTSTSLITRSGNLSRSNPLLAQFQEPPSALQFAEIEGRTCLFAGVDDQLFQWTLGHNFDAAF
ncbi:hypothetical protein K488DRAFT_81987 [Vararia minispora EC-137]|uniref:Uncharacterized protein n=1 Tax=Vararia minispora EC-137 TaxID=1314806 RepID=A0ACB8QYD0_9AGAM|nr:hypothetical protein K488DRAFT_81987 [Vararia minispora EC-137]